MGSDDLFKKRKARASADLVRQRQARAQIPRCLIVCEGSKTEPQYLSELRDIWGIPHISVSIKPSRGASPDQVVQTAELLYDDDAKLGDSYDKVFCVFDRDEHSTFKTAVQQIRGMVTAGKPFNAITSTPCIELWFLLHFGYSDAPFSKQGKKSVGDVAVSQLKTREGFKQYGKGQRGVAALLLDRLPQARKHAARLRKAALTAQDNDPQLESNPWTNMDELILYIEHMRSV